MIIGGGSCLLVTQAERSWPMTAINNQYFSPRKVLPQWQRRHKRDSTWFLTSTLSWQTAGQMWPHWRDMLHIWKNKQFDNIFFICKQWSDTGAEAKTSEQRCTTFSLLPAALRMLLWIAAASVLYSWITYRKRIHLIISHLLVPRSIMVCQTFQIDMLNHKSTRLFGRHCT